MNSLGFHVPQTGGIDLFPQNGHVDGQIRLQFGQLLFDAAQFLRLGGGALRAVDAVMMFVHASACC